MFLKIKKKGLKLFHTYQNRSVVIKEILTLVHG